MTPAITGSRSELHHQPKYCTECVTSQTTTHSVFHHYNTVIYRVCYIILYVLVVEDNDIMMST